MENFKMQQERCVARIAFRLDLAASLALVRDVEWTLESEFGVNASQPRPRG